MVARPLPIQGLPAALDGARLVHFSDIHLGPRVADDYLLDTFRRVAALQPDIVVVTGDFTSDHGDVIDHTKRIYSHFPHGRLATVGTLGNHDYGRRLGRLGGTPPQLTATLGALRACTCSATKSWTWTASRSSAWTTCGRGCFQPSQALAAVEHAGTDAGPEPQSGYRGSAGLGALHRLDPGRATPTAGSVKPPFLPPPMLPVQNRRYTAGEFELAGSRRLYISRGVGHILQVRFNVRPEVTVFELQKV